MLEVARAALKGLPGGPVELRALPRVESTNTALKQELARGELAAPLLLLTGDQYAGRGTRGRGWLMQPGRDLAFSIAAPDCGGAAFEPRLTLALGAVVAKALAQYCPGVGVSWPNDVVAGPPLGARKLGGILVETVVHPATRQRWYIAGVGINVNSTAADFPPELALELTTLRDEMHRLRPAGADASLDLGQILASLARAILALLASDGGGETWEQTWRALDRTAGKTWLYQRGDRSVRVTAEEIDLASGELLARDEAGLLHRIRSYTDLSRARG